MKTIRDATEDEIILTFLNGEIHSERFSAKLNETIKQIKASKEIIINGNLTDKNENLLRKQILSLFRGYPDKELFDNFPAIIKWKFVQFGQEDLNKIYYIDYDYWNELSKGTSKPTEAAQSIYEGIEIFGVSNEPMFKAKEFLRTGTFPPIIAYTCGNEKYLLLEGHKRMTVYGMLPEKFENTYGYIGYCSIQAMYKKDPRMVN